MTNADWVAVLPQILLLEAFEEEEAVFCDFDLRSWLVPLERKMSIRTFLKQGERGPTM